MDFILNRAIVTVSLVIDVMADSRYGQTEKGSEPPFTFSGTNIFQKVFDIN